MRVSLLSSESQLGDDEKNPEMANVDFQLGFVPSAPWAKHQKARVVPTLAALSIVTLPAATWYNKRIDPLNQDHHTL